MQTAKAASTVARIAEHIIALWHSKVFTFWSHRLEKRLIDESIENKILMGLCCNRVVLLRLTRRGRAGRPKNPAKKSKVPAPVNHFAQSIDVIVAVTLAAPACDQHNPYCFHRVSAFGGKADMSAVAEHTFKISHKICEEGCARARQTNFGPPPPPVRRIENRECLFDRRGAN